MSTECCQNEPSKECCKNEPAKECCQDGASKGCCKDSCCLANLGHIYGSMLLRLWLGVRAVQTGIEKYAGVKASDQVVKIDGSPNEYGLTASASVKNYALENYHGVPASLMEKFQSEPLMLKFALPLYDKLLGPALLVLGVAILLGFAYRSSLFLLGLLYISLTWGLILIKQDDGVSWLGVHMILIVMALALAKHNCLGIFKKW